MAYNIEPEGKYKVDRQERRQLRADLRKIIRAGDEVALIKILRVHGLREGDPDFENTLEVFRQEARKHRKR